jgi:Zn-dependent peptidase ImmA (M78 family)
MTNDAGQRARAAARRVLQTLRIEAIDEIDIEAIAALHRLHIVSGDLHGADGRSVMHGGAGIIRIRTDITQAERRRFIVAHELAHCLLHKGGSVALCTEGDLFRYEEGNLEAEANWFAAELLMPGNLFRPACNVPKPTFDAIRIIARRFTTTLTATAIRFVQLGPERCALIWSENNRVKWSVRSDDFPAFIERERELSTYSLASNVFRSKPLPREAQPVPQKAWLDMRVVGGRDLVEETLAFSRLDAALSLIWLPMVDDEEDDDRDWQPWRGSR